MAIDINKHKLVPKHSKLTDSEIKKLAEQYNASFKLLPKILLDDPAIAKFNPKPGDIIKIERASKTAGNTVFYRAVVQG